MTLTLYDATLSPNAMRVRAVAYELGIPLTLINVDLGAGENKAASYVDLNPNAKVPLLVDDGFVLWESRAIVAYLAGLAPERRLYPDDLKARAKVDQWSYWQALHLGPPMQRLALERFFKERFRLGTPDRAAIEAAEAETARYLAVLDLNLSGREWVAGALSVADFTMGSTFVFRDAAGISLAGFPHVAGWIARLDGRPSWRKVVAEMMGALGP